MSSRMDRYQEGVIGSRSKKNANLYKEVSKQSIKDFNVNSNASVIGNSKDNIDLEMLKDMLDKKYREPLKKKPSFELDDNDDVSLNLDETKEYDINAILEKAKEEKVVDYETERLKKIRDTQYDILKSLDLDEKEEKNEEVKKQTEEERLMTLINTITANELGKEIKKEIGKDVDPLDLFTDLKATDENDVLDGITPTSKIDTDKIKSVIKEEVKEQIDNSFYTKSMNLKDQDFETFKDLQDDVKSNRVLVKILTIIVILAFLFGIFLFLNIYFKWGII